MGQHVTRTDFEWVYTEEPHATRRKIILKKHPEVTRLMGHDTNLKWAVLGIVIFQLISAWLVRDLSWPTILLLAYCLGGTVNHSMTLAIHEIAHNLAFGHSRPLANRFLGMFANLPLGVPMSISFKKYHLEHHKFQGADGIDMDIPTEFEGRFFTSSGLKIVWLLLQPFFYTLRPLFVRPLPMNRLELLNIIVQFLFNGLVIHFIGLKSLIYLILGTMLSTGLHPVAGHFISEHYMFEQGYETYSYYGPLNYITFNVGYHNEHHDFPYIPGSRLPQLRKMAPEFYDTIPSHTSWLRVLYDFIVNPAVGPFARIKRQLPLPVPVDVNGNIGAQLPPLTNGHTVSSKTNGHTNKEE